MAYVHIRIDDDFYKAVQTVLETKLKTDISTFIRDILRDTLLIYADEASKEAAFSATGRKHEAQGTPILILDMVKDFAEKPRTTMTVQLAYAKPEWSLGNKAGSPGQTKKKRIPVDSKHRG